MYQKYFYTFVVKKQLMRVIAKKALVDFYTLYPDAKLSLENWYRKTIDAQ